MGLWHGVTQIFFYTVFDYDFCQYLLKWVAWSAGFISVWSGGRVGLGGIVLYVVCVRPYLVRYLASVLLFYQNIDLDNKIHLMKHNLW